MKTERGSFAAPTGLAAVKLEAAFYREQLELICKDSRKTRARRLAESALTFWDSLKVEAAKRKKTRAASDQAQRPPPEDGGCLQQEPPNNQDGTVENQNGRR